MKIVILGNGIAGITAARFIRKRSDHEVVVVSDESDEFFSRTALMYIYMGHLRLRDTMPYESWFWDKNRIRRVRARIERIDFDAKTLFDAAGRGIDYDKLLIATGSKSNKFGWPGQDLDGVHGLYHLQDLEAMERHSAALGPGKGAVVVGGGLIGVEMAEMFHSRKIPVTFLVREPDFWNNILPAEESAMVSRHLPEHHIDLRVGTELKEILDDGAGKCRAVVTHTGETVPCGFVGLTVGVSPNIDFLKNSGLELNRGILVDEYLETNIPGVFAAGDCAELRQPPPGRKPIEAVWYVGRMMGETAAHNLITDYGLRIADYGLRIADWIPSLERPNLQSAIRNPQSAIPNPQSYTPGFWFNSAKFFDIEYQVYGDIRAALPAEHATLYWEHPGGKKSIRINFHRREGYVVGFNLMGVRYRHEVCDKWLRQKTPVEAVLQQLGLANFDPEFYPQHETELVRLYNAQTGAALQLKQKRGLDAVLGFLQMN